MADKGPAPSLATAFSDLGTSLSEQVEICSSKTIPYNIVENCQAQSPDWDVADIEDNLQVQCDELLPGLLGQQAEERAAEKAAAAKGDKAEDDKKKKEQAAADKEKKAAEDKKKKEEDEKKRKAAAEEKAKKDAEAKKKKEADDKQKAADKEKKAEEDKKKKEEAAANKAAADEEKKKKAEEDKKKKAEEDKRKAADKEKKAAEDKRKREEDAKKKAEEDKRKAAEKEKKDAEAKAAKAKKEEEDRKKKEEKAAEDKKKAEEKEKRDAEKKIEDEKKKKEQEEAKKKKAEEDKKKKEEDEKKKKAEAEQKKKEKEAADKKKEAEKKKKEAKQAADKAKKEEEKRQREEEKKKKEEEKKKEKEERARAKEERRKQKEEEEKGSSEEEWDEEKGMMVKKKRKPKMNDRVYTEDPGCGCGHGSFKCCRSFSFILLFIIIPATYALLIFLEYESYGWGRFVARSAGEGYNLTDFNQPSPAPAPGADEDDELKPSKSQMIWGFLKKNPLAWIMPLIGLAMGLFANIVPMAGGLILMPLFEELEVTKSSEATLALACMAQFINSGVLGFISWCSRDARFFICRALFTLTPFAWGGYMLGVTNNLTLKDLLISIDKEVDDPGFKEELDKNDIDLLHTYIRIGFGCFMVFMSLWVVIGACIGGMNRYCCPSRTGGTTPGCKSFCQWIIVICCSFNTGWFFVANIGAGMGVTTFFCLSLFLGVETKRAMPTSIVVGAWTALAPALSNWVVLEAFPYIRLLMMIPGMWFGSILAPWFSRCGGPICDLVLFFFTLLICGTAVVAFAAIKLQKMKEDVDIDIAPIYSIPVVDEWFAKKGEGHDADAKRFLF